jgi:alkanesulfonate monooxygenase SsuD/methylene tetrahydromethanopterin reductase-like flavin-dependent oxidoreductase (luciferase family)
MSRIGIAISGGPNPAEIIDLVILAESFGYESAWVAEGHGGDQFAILAACAARTSQIRLGTRSAASSFAARQRLPWPPQQSPTCPVAASF